MEFMKAFEEQDGISFFLIYFSKREIYYYLRFEEAVLFWNRSKEKNGRKSFRSDELDEKFFFKEKPPALVPYLDMINLDLSNRS